MHPLGKMCHYEDRFVRQFVNRAQDYMLEVLIEILEMTSHGDHKSGRPGGMTDKKRYRIRSSHLYNIEGVTALCP